MSIFCMPGGASGVFTSLVKNSSAAFARYYSIALGSYFVLFEWKSLSGYVPAGMIIDA
jgi:hypothetical protein